MSVFYLKEGTPWERPERAKKGRRRIQRRRRWWWTREGVRVKRRAPGLRFFESTFRCHPATVAPLTEALPFQDLLNPPFLAGRPDPRTLRRRRASHVTPSASGWSRGPTAQPPTKSTTTYQLQHNVDHGRRFSLWRCKKGYWFLIKASNDPNSPLLNFPYYTNFYTPEIIYRGMK